ncbi:hypothetical protein H5410_062705 [Solanum commersonii]|uniref:Putative plant transposon protein domain-containing protein n=1 Tax=Solanum commersonii TaxID=4109 RepID=A0A9J5WB49_SOLCO|nr:hypothetical protein H5410_062705 [Solanum commersonii]
MALKAKNMAGSKRSRKEEASGPLAVGNQYKNLEKRLCKGMVGNGLHTVNELGLRFIFENLGDYNLTLVREIYANWLTKTKYKTVPVRGKDVKFSARILNELLGSPNCDHDEFNCLKDKPPYRDIRHTLCGVDSNARWERSKDTGRHNTLHFANFNQVAWVWLKIGMPINIGVILRQNMMKFRNNLRWRFCYGGLITHFMRDKGIDEETVDMTVAYHPDLTERQTRDNSVMVRMFSMAELQLRIGGRPVTDEEIETLADRYSLTESAAFLCRSGLTFMEPLDDDEATADEAMDDEKDDDVVDMETNALMELQDHD